MIKINLGIDGMMCGMCETHVNDAIRNNFKVKKISTSHVKGTAEIVSEVEIPEEDIKKVIEQTGYKLTSFDSEPYEKKKSSLFFK